MTRFALKDADLPGLTVVGKPFEVVAYQGSDTDDWGEPLPEFSLQQFGNEPPAVVTMAYDDDDISGIDEADLHLYRLTGNEWAAVETTCLDYKHQFMGDNLIAVPICETGIYAFNHTEPDDVWPPAPQFIADPTSGSSPLTVTFTDQSLYYPIEWVWNFGDGASSTAQHPIHTYVQSGSMTVTLTVSNGPGSATMVEPEFIVIDSEETVGPIYLPIIMKEY